MARLNSAAVRRSAMRGFTLVEMMVVITILVIVLGAGMPLTTQWLDEAKARQAAGQIRLAYSKARALALLGNSAFLCVASGQVMVFPSITAKTNCSDSGASWLADLPGGSSTVVYAGTIDTGNKSAASTLACIAFDTKGWPISQTLDGHSCADATVSTITVTRGSAYAASRLY